MRTMSEISERYARLATLFADKIAAVPADRWASAAPCEGWVARDVVAHVIETQGMFLGFIGKELGAVPDAAADPLAAWTATHGVVQSFLNDPAIAQTEFDSFFGPTTFEASVNRFLCFDLVVHNWDLSRAAGLDETLDPDDVARVNKLAIGFGDSMRAPNAFGPELQTTKNDPQSKLLAFLGREP